MNVAIKKDWLETSLRGRLEWYQNEIGSLANYMEDKEPFTYREVKICMGYLENINERLKIDQRLISVNLKSTNRNHKIYFESVSFIMKNLPEPNSTPRDWLDNLYDILENILYAKDELAG